MVCLRMGGSISQQGHQTPGCTSVLCAPEDCPTLWWSQGSSERGRVGLAWSVTYITTNLEWQPMLQLPWGPCCSHFQESRPRPDLAFHVLGFLKIFTGTTVAQRERFGRFSSNICNVHLPIHLDVNNGSSRKTAAAEDSWERHSNNTTIGRMKKRSCFLSRHCGKDRVEPSTQICMKTYEEVYITQTRAMVSTRQATLELRSGYRLSISNLKV